MTALQTAARIGSLLCVLAAGAILVPVTVTSSSAQTFYSIYGGARNAPPTPYRDERYQETGNPFVDFFGAVFGTRRRYEDDIDKKKGNAFAHHCVRTCDGKFFPVSRGGRKDLSLEKICSAMCPSAQTKIFTGPGIDQSTAPDGQKYSAMPNAFLYRTQVVENCTCNGRDPFGVASVDLENDLTLQGGDIVVRPTGLAVYRGPNSYVPIQRSGLSPAFVKQLMAIKVLPNNPHAAHAMTVTVRQTPSDVPEFLNKNASPETPAPNANAPAVNPPARTN